MADVHVDPGPNARSDDEQELVALRDSIARPRILQPLVVHARDEGGVWLVAGHRRLAAAKAAGLEKVPAAAEGDTQPQSWGEMLPGGAIAGAVFAFVKAAIGRAAVKGFPRVTGSGRRAVAPVPSMPAM